MNLRHSCRSCAHTGEQRCPLLLEIQWLYWLLWYTCNLLKYGRVTWIFSFLSCEKRFWPMRRPKWLFKGAEQLRAANSDLLPMRESPRHRGSVHRHVQSQCRYGFPVMGSSNADWHWPNRTEGASIFLRIPGYKYWTDSFRQYFGAH